MTYNSLDVNIGPRVNNGISDYRGARRSHRCIAGSILSAGVTVVWYWKWPRTYVEDEVVFVSGVPYVTMLVSKLNAKLTSKESIVT